MDTPAYILIRPNLQQEGHWLNKLFEKVEYMNLYGADSQKVIVEGEILLPEIKPDIIKILQTDADVFITNVEVSSDKVTVQGEVNFKVIYLSNDDSRKVSFVSSSAEFTKIFDILGVKAGMDYEIKDDLIYSYCSALSSRKIAAKAILDLSIMIKNPVMVEFLNDIEDSSIKYLKEAISISSPKNIVENISKKEILELPQGKPSIREILRSYAKLSDKNIKYDGKKIAVELKVDMKTLYSPDIGTIPIDMVEHEMFINHSIEVPDSTEGLEPMVKFYIQQFRVTPKTDELGELRRIEYDIEVEVEITFNKIENITPIVDIYSTSHQLREIKKHLSVEEFIGQSRQTLTLKDVVSLQDEPEQVFSSTGRVEIDSIKALKDAIEVKGVLIVFMIYISKDAQNLLKSITAQIPFTHRIDMQRIIEEDRALCEIEIENLSFSILSSHEIEIRCHLSIEVWAKRLRNIEIISDVDFEDKIEKDEGRLSAIYIYTVQKGDTLWKIAKNYKTTVERIMNFNQLENDKIFPGQKLLIVR